METRLAYQIALLAALSLCGRGVWQNSSVADTLEHALIGGVVGWVLGYVSSQILMRLAYEHVAALAGETAEPADQVTKSTERISAPGSNN